MRFLSRAGIVLALLGILGYGSYAFGRYVLSSALFGNSVVPAGGSGLVAVSPTAVTRKTEFQGSEPRVEVQVMDADTAGPGPAPPSIEDLRRSAEERAASRGPSRAVEPDAQNTPSTVVRRSTDRDLDDGVLLGDEDRPRRRRKKRRKTSDEAAARAAENSTARTSTDSTDNASAETSISVVPDGESDSGSQGGRSRGADDSGSSSTRPGRSVTSDDSATEVRPRRRRRRRVETSTSSTPRPRERSRTIESPVPQPEGGESPVPMPE